MNVLWIINYRYKC